MTEYLLGRVSELAAVIDSIPVDGNYRLALGGIAGLLSILAIYATLRVAMFLVPAGVNYAWQHIEEKMQAAENAYWGRLRRLGFTKRTLWILAWTLLTLTAGIMISDIAMEKSLTKAVLIQFALVPVVVILGSMFAYFSLDNARREAFDRSRFFFAFMKPMIGAILVLNAHNFVKFGGKYALANVLPL